MDVCSDPARPWFPYRTVCYPTMEEAAARREYDRIHEERPYHDGRFAKWSPDRTEATPYHYMDGVEIGVAEVDVNPADEFLKAPDLFGRDQSLLED